MLTQFQVSPADNLRKSIRLALDDLAVPKPEFRFEVGWAHDYDGLFQDVFTENTEIGEILLKAKEVGRVLICAKGGAGKTVVIHRLARMAFEQGTIPFVLDLKRWNAQHYTRWSEIEPDNAERIKFLLQHFATPRTTPAVIDALPASVDKILLVDGLNEVLSSTGKEIIDVLDDFVRYAIQTSVVVTDRMTRREFRDESRWRLGSILPLNEAEIRSHLRAKSRNVKAFDDDCSGEIGLLTTPYFLDAVLKSVAHAFSSSRMLHDYLAMHANMGEGELDQAGIAAFRVYEATKSRTFPLTTFETIADDKVTGKLLEAGILNKDGSFGFFDHHLTHDYLVSRYLAKSRATAWSHGPFDVVTLDASSFDALALTLQQLESPDESDKFIRRVYDWNLYGAAYSVTEAACGLVSITQEMKIFLLAMLAERQWDLILSTANRARDALRLFPKSESEDFLNSSNLNDVFQLVQRVQSREKWFLDWRSIFTRAPLSQITDEELMLIQDTDSVVGWTYANVLKRLSLTENQQRMLADLVNDATEPVRWRIAHVFGSFPGLENTELLVKLFDSDPYVWVRVGAIRSLIESAALSDSTGRRAIYEKLEKRADALLKDPKCLRQFEQSIFIVRSRAPEDWARSTFKVLEALRRSVDSFGSRERFQTLAYKLKEQYGI